jgi:crotonobetainyl-CoA:carnitine CoA-transferase CaiB-like acyl-CoA transferase
VVGRPVVGGALADTLVVDLSIGIAGAYCTKLLADGGATVVKVEDPAGDPLRRWSASGAAIAPGDDGALFSFLAGSKGSVVVDAAAADELLALTRLFDAADAVVWSEGSTLAALPQCAPAAIAQAHPHVVVAAITPFGLDGPWAGRAATEFTLQAWSGGAVGLGRGYPDRSPLVVGGQVGEWLSGTYAAIGVLASLARGGGSDRAGELVDVSMLEALATCLTYYPVTFAEIAGRPYRSGRSVPSPGVEAASDGLVGLGTGTGQQWLDLCVMVGHPEWADDATLRTERWRIAPAIREWAASRTVAEIVDLAAAFRIPHAPVGNGATIPVTDHFVARGSLVNNPRDGFREPGPPYRTTPDLLRAPEPAPRLGETAIVDVITGRSRRVGPSGAAGEASRPLEGVRVLDLTAFWAGPVVTQMLGMLGAEVIHVESPTRPDGTRMLANLPFSDDQWWERCGIFSALNVNKRSVTLDLADERGRAALRVLLATCDVVVENYTPRVLEQLGLEFESARAIRPDLVMVRMPGFGLDGPWRDNAAFAFVVEDAAGFTWMTGYADTNPISPYCIGDPAAGLHACTGLLLALEHRRRTGEGVLVEAAMVDAALNVTAEQIVEHSAYGALLERDGNRGPTAAPQNLYRTADMTTAADGSEVRDSWAAIAVATDAQWDALRTALGDPSWAADPQLTIAAGRRARHDDVDACLGAWCATRTVDEIVTTLWEAGVPVAPVVLPHDQAGLAQLKHRGWFEVVDHPVNGPARHSTLPMRFSRGPDRLIHRHAPLFGEHTREILLAAGVTGEELDAMEADGVSGRAPAGASG